MGRVAKIFVISGSIGVGVALVLYLLAATPIVGIHIRINPYIMLALVPASIMGLAEPTTLSDKLLLTGIVLGTNFFLYGVLGLVLSALSYVLRSSTTKS